MNLKNADKVLFLNIETAPQYDIFESAPIELQQLFLQRFSKDVAELKDAFKYQELWNEKASLYPEFGKIICISVGMVYNGKFVTKSFVGDDEKQLLSDFVSGKLMDKLNDISGGTIFCAYSGESFLFPFIAKRLIMNGVLVPKVFFYPNLKPWERNFLVDLRTTWRWDVYDATISLKLLAYSLGVGNDDQIDGKMIKDIYYVERDLKKISSHCEHDVELLFNSYNKLHANFANA